MIETGFKFGEVYSLFAQVEPGKEGTHFKRIFENENGGVSLLAFEAGQELHQHLAPAELMVCVMQGEIEFTMIDQPHVIHAGEFMLVGEGVPHSVKANADSKVMLVKVKG